MKNRNEAVRTMAAIMSALVAGCGCLILGIAMLANDLTFAGIGLVAIIVGGFAVISLEN